MKSYNLTEFERDVQTLAQEIRLKQNRANIFYKGIYAVPRGGIPLGMALSHELDISLIELLPVHLDGLVLVVDDLVDSGKTREQYKGYDYACLHVKNHTISSAFPTYYVSVVDDWIEYWWEKGEHPVEDIVLRLIEYIGENPNREGLRETPQRVAKMYKEVFSGYVLKPPKITCFENKRQGGLIIDRGYFYSFCEHHIIPFFGDFYFGYIPDKLIVGASKIDRTVDYYSNRLQIAETLCADILDRIEEEIKPRGSILIMTGRHLCKEMRGVKKHNSPFETIEARGILLKNEDGCKDEFMSRIGSRI